MSSTRHFAVAFSAAVALVAACTDATISRDPALIATAGPPASPPAGQAGSTLTKPSAGAAGSAAAGEGGADADGGKGGAEAQASAGTGGAGQGGAAGKGDKLLPECIDNAPGAKMTRLTRADGRSACIDQREVTQAEYHAFAQAVAAKKSQLEGFCDPKRNSEEQLALSYPEPTWGGTDYPPYAGQCKFGEYHPDKTPDVAMSCVHPCQADAYCAWVGKEVCGRFDSAEPLDQAAAEDPQQSIWMFACTNGGKTTQSHEGTEPGTCGATDWGNGAPPYTVDAYPACHGQDQLADVFNVSANVAEHLNARWTHDPAYLPVRQSGGPRSGVADSGGPCGLRATGPKWTIGFRCCQRLAQP